MATPTGTLVDESTQYLDSSKRNFWIWLVITVLVGIVAGLLVIQEPALIIGAAIILLFFVGIVVFIGRRAFSSPKKFEVYDDGFILRTTDTNEVVDSGLWTEVEDIKWSVDKRKSRRQSMGYALFGVIGMMIANMMSDENINEETDLYIHRPNQKKLTIDVSYQYPNRPHLAVRRTTRDVWMSQIDEKIRYGETVDFGKVQLTQTGVQQRQQFAEWSSIVDTQVKDDMGTVAIMWQDPNRKKPREMKTKLGFKGLAMVELVRDKAGLGSSLGKKLGKL